MASITPISAQCNACQDVVELHITTKLTSELAPPGAAVLFIEVDQTPLDRHTATHEADAQERLAA